MKSKSLNFIVPLKVYPFEILVSIGESDERLRNVLLKFMDKEYHHYLDNSQLFNLSDTTKAISVQYPDNTTILRMHAKPYYCEDFGELAHEIFHCVTFVMDKVGIKFELFKSDEAYAYLISYLSTEIYKKLNSK